MRVHPLSEKPNPGGPFRFLLLCALIGVVLGFAVKYADVVTQAILTAIRYLTEVAVAMMIAPGQAGDVSALVLGGMFAALSAGSALAVGVGVVVVWHIYRRRAEYG